MTTEANTLSIGSSSPRRNARIILFATERRGSGALNRRISPEQLVPDPDHASQDRIAALLADWANGDPAARGASRADRL